IRIETHDTLRQRQILLSLPDQLVRHYDIASVDRKAAQRDMRTVRDRLNNLCNRLHLVGHGPWSSLTRGLWKGEEAIRTGTRTQADLPALPASAAGLRQAGVVIRAYRRRRLRIICSKMGWYVANS